MRKFKEIILEVAKGCCGVKKISDTTTKKTGWWTEEVQTKIKAKKMAWKEYLCTKHYGYRIKENW